MSKGSPIVTARLPVDVYEEMLAAIEQANLVRCDAPQTIGGYILRAIREKLAKRKRNNSYHRRLRQRRHKDRQQPSPA